VRGKSVCSETGPGCSRAVGRPFPASLPWLRRGGKLGVCDGRDAPTIPSIGPALKWPRLLGSLQPLEGESLGCPSAPLKAWALPSRDPSPAFKARLMDGTLPGTAGWPQPQTKKKSYCALRPRSENRRSEGLRGWVLLRTARGRMVVGAQGSACHHVLEQTGICTSGDASPPRPGPCHAVTAELRRTVSTAPAPGGSCSGVGLGLWAWALGSGSGLG